MSSKILNDLINDVKPLNQILDRLLLIAMDLSDEFLLSWITLEKEGYKPNDVLPSYRIIKTAPTGDYTIGGIGYGYIQQIRNSPLPQIGLSEEIKEKFSKLYLRNSLVELIDLKKDLENGKFHGYPIPHEIWPCFEEGTNITIVGASLNISKFEIDKVLDAIKTKIMKIVKVMEKNFGPLDELDISNEKYSIEELNEIKRIVNDILQDKITSNIIVINDSKIKKSNIGSDNKIEKKAETNIELNLNKQDRKECILKKILKKMFKK